MSTDVVRLGSTESEGILTSLDESENLNPHAWMHDSHWLSEGEPIHQITFGLGFNLFFNRLLQNTVSCLFSCLRPMLIFLFRRS